MRGGGCGLGGCNSLVFASQNARVQIAVVACTGATITEHALQYLQSRGHCGLHIMIAAQLGIDLYQIHALHTLSIAQCLHNADALAQRETATHCCPCAGRHMVVEGVDVEAHVDLVLWIQCIQCHLNDFGHASPIDGLHRERESEIDRLERDRLGVGVCGGSMYIYS